MSANQTRLLWLDVSKGLGIFLVVCGHVYLGLVGANLLPDQNDLLSTLYQTKFLFNMPFFFLIAGLTVESSLRKGKREFVHEKIATISYPFFLWSFIIVWLQSMAAGVVNTEKSLGMLWNIWYDPPSPFWMLYSLLICHLVLACLPEKHRLLGMLLLTTVALAGMFGITSLQQTMLDKENLIYRTIYHAWFYALGICCSQKIIASPGGWRVTACYGLAFAAAAAFYFQLVTDFEAFHVSALPGALCGTALILSYSKTIRGPWAEFWAVLGRASMSIYVMHVIFGAATRVALLKLGIRQPVVHLVLGIVLATAIPLAIHLFLKHRDWLFYLGLGRRRGLPAVPVTAPLPAQPSAIPASTLG